MTSARSRDGYLARGLNEGSWRPRFAKAVTYPSTRTATGKDFFTFRARARFAEQAGHSLILNVTHTIEIFWPLRLASTARARARSSCKCTPYDPTVTHSIVRIFSSVLPSDDLAHF